MVACNVAVTNGEIIGTGGVRMDHKGWTYNRTNCPAVDMSHPNYIYIPKRVTYAYFFRLQAENSSAKDSTRKNILPNQRAGSEGVWLSTPTIVRWDWCNVDAQAQRVDF